MKNTPTHPTLKSGKAAALGLMMAALIPTGAALAHGSSHGHSHGGPDVSGTVVVTKQIPGGVVTVGATIGKPRPVVVEQRKVVVVEKQAPSKVVIVKKQEPPKVVVVRKNEPVRKVVVVKKEQPKKVVVVDRHGHHNKNHSHHSHGPHQVSKSYSGPDGHYHYYEDARQVSISDNRGGQTRHVYVRK